MKVYEIQGAFGLENLKLVERDEPHPGPGEVLLRMKAASLNYRDLLMVQGMYNPRQPLPLIPFSDGVGEVVETGEGVGRVAVGDRVCPIFVQRWLSGEPNQEKLRSTLGGPLDGTLAEYMVLDEEGLVQVPAYLSDDEASCLPCAAMTAWSALVEQGNLCAGQTVLIQGTGGVSLFALQFAQILGARVIVTSSSDKKLERALELGAAEGINYKENPDWAKQVRQLTEGAGVDHIVEVGGAETLKQSLRAIRVGGQISLIGVLSGVSSQLPLTLILMQNVRLQGILVGHREGFEAMNRALSVHQIHPVIDGVFPFAEAPAALEYLGSAQHLGKICLHF